MWARMPLADYVLTLALAPRLAGTNGNKLSISPRAERRSCGAHLPPFTEIVKRALVDPTHVRFLDLEFCKDPVPSLIFATLAA
jgi:hypothetical protein